MVRFQVIKASQILYYAVLAVIAITAVVILLVTMLGGREEASPMPETTKTPVSTLAPSALPHRTTVPSALPSALPLPEVEPETQNQTEIQTNGGTEELTGNENTFAAEEQSAGAPLALVPVLPAFAANRTTSFHVEVISTVAEPEDKLRILIYHTHTWEAYQQMEGDRYEETETWRTKDPAYNMIAVGERLAEELEALGVEVVHDTTEFEPPKLGTAYERSLAMLQQRKDAGEKFDLTIDLHRDAGTTPIVAAVEGQECAKLMVLLGNGKGFQIQPDYEANLRFAEELTDQLQEIVPELCRKVKTKDGRYNQHMNTPAILVEVGNNRNTLQQAMNSMPYLAKCLLQTLSAEA